MLIFLFCFVFDYEAFLSIDTTGSFHFSKKKQRSPFLMAPFYKGSLPTLCLTQDMTLRMHLVKSYKS